MSENRNGRVVNLKGKRFGRLVVLEQIGTKIYSGDHHALWKCQCDCGNVVEVAHLHLVSNSQGYSTKSCGCLGKEMRDKNNPISPFYGGSSVNFIASDKLGKRNTSGCKGVSFDKSRGKWAASIMLKGKRYHLGRCNEKEQAIKIRKEAEQRLFEPFIEWYKEQQINGGV